MTLDDWLAFGRVDLESIYQTELGRSAFSDSEAFVNWAYWRLGRGMSLEWIRDRIRESDEWRLRHGSSPPAPGPQTVIRVTSAQDGQLLNRGYSYWSQAVRTPDGTVLAFVGHADEHPRFFRVSSSGAVTRLGALIPYATTGEGWYFDREGWIYLCDGPRLRRWNPLTGENHIIFECEPQYILWQAHSSDDGLVHSATLRNAATYQTVGWTAHRVGHGSASYPLQGAPDECQIDASGRWLVIKEDDDNRIITLATGEERRISNAEGAFGHSDCGNGFMVGEDDQRGACMWMDLSNPDSRRVLFSTWNMGHVSVRGSRCLLSGPKSLSLVPLAGGQPEHLIDHGMVGEGYDFQVMGNLDPSGQIAAFVSNKEGRMDLYVAVLP